MGWQVKSFKVPGSKYKGFAVGTKDIVNDKDIKWGFPFEAAASAPVQRISEQEMKNLRDTANRAAKILNEKGKIVEQLTGFNKNLGE